MQSLLLTIDDGFGPNASVLLDLLGEHNIKALHFIIGKQTDNDEGIKTCLRAIREGHRLGNHTYDHPIFGRNKEASIVQEQIAKNDAFLRKVYRESGKVYMPAFRYPGGISAKCGKAILQKMSYRAPNGLRHWAWDWQPAKYPKMPNLNRPIITMLHEYERPEKIERWIKSCLANDCSFVSPWTIFYKNPWPQTNK